MSHPTADCGLRSFSGTSLTGSGGNKDQRTDAPHRCGVPFQAAVSLRACAKLTVLSGEPVASSHHHADVARVHFLGFSFEAQPVSELRVGETHLDVGPITQSQGKEGPPP